MLPLFVLRRGKYAQGFAERFGDIPEFSAGGRPVIWVHCVSVGEVNAARPLVKGISEAYPDYRIVVSTVTRSGQDLAHAVYGGVADLIFYFPFDWQFTVRRAIQAIRPNMILVMETEIWFNFFRETKRRGVTLAIVNGRLSEKSVRRYQRIPKTIRRVLRYVDAAFVQTQEEARRFKSLGMSKRKLTVTGNLKFDQRISAEDHTKTAYFRERFSITQDSPLIIAASTHENEENWMLEAFGGLVRRRGCERARLMIAPRHPERFSEVAEMIRRTGLPFARRSGALDLDDGEARIILLDSIGELRSVYPLAEIVFVGGSLVPHGGQNILEPALECKAIVTGPHMMNFEAIAREFEEADALLKLPESSEANIPSLLEENISRLILDISLRRQLGGKAYGMIESNRGATERTLNGLKPFLDVQTFSAVASPTAVAEQ